MFLFPCKRLKAIPIFSHMLRRSWYGQPNANRLSGKAYKNIWTSFGVIQRHFKWVRVCDDSHLRCVWMGFILNTCTSSPKCTTNRPQVDLKLTSRISIVKWVKDLGLSFHFPSKKTLNFEHLVCCFLISPHQKTVADNRDHFSHSDHHIIFWPFYLLVLAWPPSRSGLTFMSATRTRGALLNASTQKQPSESLRNWDHVLELPH